MKKTNLVIIGSLILVFIVLAVSLPYILNRDLPRVQTLYNRNNEGPLINNSYMNAGDTFTIDKSTFNGLEKHIESMKGFGTDKSDIFELFILGESRKNVLTIENDTVRAENSGFAVVAANLYKKGLDNNGEKIILKVINVIIAEVYVINEETMIPITSAEDLANMKNDLDGHYILKSDIDLADWGDWEPIGLHITYNSSPGFSGMFVNPFGYKIKNLTITSNKSILSSWIGLFGLLTDRAYIDGIILEDISIDVSDYDGTDIVASPTVGGIAGVTTPGVIISNCIVNGTILGSGECTGGIIGENNCGIISNSSYNGTIKVVNNNVIGIFSVGGIAGYNNHSHRENDGWEVIPNIIDCKVNADIENSAISGGIIGYTNFKGAVKDSSFTGTLVGKYSGTMIGMEARGSEKPIDFD